MEAQLVYLPYIVSIVCSVIAGLSSYLVARKQTKADIKRLEKQYELDLEKEKEKFAMEKERMEIEHRHQLELKQKEMEAQIGSDILSTMTKAYIQSPAGQAQMRNPGNKKRH